jgi:hypothetical protein
MDDFSERIPCSDGKCIGIINERGVCNICGKSFRGEEKKRKEDDFDFSERIPCSDGSCIGIINEKGFCNVCGKPLRGEQERGERERREQEQWERYVGGEKGKGKGWEDEKLVRCLEILGLKPDTTKEELKQGYKDLAQILHPDRYNNNPRLRKKAEEKFKEINQAYQYIMSLNYFK